MKKYICAALAFAMIAGMFAGCGRGNVSDHPGGMITESTAPAATTNPMPTMTEPMTTHATVPTMPHGTDESQNTIPNSTDSTDGSEHIPGGTDHGRSRGIHPDSRS